MAVKWKNEWNNESYLNATSMFKYAKKEKEYTQADADRDYNRGYFGYYDLGGFGNFLAGIMDFFTGFNKSAEHDATQRANVDSVIRAKRQLNTQYNEWVDQINLGYDKLVSNLNASNTQLQNSANTTIENRDNALNYSASFISDQRNLNNIQMRELGVQNTQSENALVQRVALSGFRNTGTMNNLVEEQQRVNRINESIKRQAFQMDEIANLESAKNSYVNATYNAYGSMDSIAENMRKYELTLKEAEQQKQTNKTNYDREMTLYDEDLDTIHNVGFADANNAMWGGVGTLVGAMLGIAFLA